MQFSPGYGSHPQNYKAPSGNFSQVPSKAIPSQPGNYYGADYYSAQCSVPAQNANVFSVTTKMLNSQGSQHLYNRAPHNAEPPGPIQGTVPPASQMHTSISQSYSSFTSPYNNSVLHSASSSVPSQGFVASSSHYPMPPVSSVAYPNIGYPPMSTDNPYGQMPSSQPVMAHGHSNAAGAYSNQTRAPPIGQPRVPLGYTSASWSAPELHLAQGNHGSFIGSLPEANNTMSTGIAQRNYM